MNKLGNLFAYYYSRYICYFINKTFFFFLINVILITKTQAQNHAPEFTSNPITTVNDTEIYRYPISASDFDGDVIEVTAPVLPEWLALTNYWVSTFAGSGIGYLDGAGVSAKFDGPSSVAIDKSGNLYVTELNNHRIRKISTDGNVTTLAGSGVAGYLDGIGIDAQFNKPGGIAVDGDGNIYVSERANHTIRKILPDGTVSTLAGSGFPGYKDSIGTNSEFSSPRGIDVDVLGNIYVSDYNNNVIRKITPDGIVSTLAGSGMLGFEDGVADTAEFRYPTDVTVDDQGHIFVCDSRNHVIREITIEGMVLTAAGTGESGFIDGAQNVAEFRFPYGIAVDGSGNLYVADGFNESVRKINSDGYTSTLAGKMSPGYKDGTGIEAKFNGVGPLALDSLGNIFMTDFNNHRIRKIESYPLLYGIALGNAGTHPVQLKVTDSQEAYSLQEFIITVNDIIPPEALCISDTVLYLNENGNANIDALGIDNGSNDASGIASLIIDSSSFNYENIGSPLLVTLTATDNFSNESTCTTTVIVLETIPESAPEFISTPVTTVIDTQNYNYNISAFDTNGNPFLISAPILPDWLLLSNEFPVGTFAGSESGYLDGNIADAKFNIPNGLVIDNLENFYIADVGNHCIRKITSQGEVYTLAGTGDEGYVDGAGTIAQFNSPLDIAIDKSGNLYVADFYNHVIRKILPDGTVSTLAGTGEAGFKNGPGNESKFNFPSGLTVDTFGNVYVSDFINHRIRKIEPNGTTTTFAGSGKGGFVNGLVENAEFFYPSDVEIDASGNLYVSDYGNNSIRKIVLSAIVSTVAGTGEIGFVDGGRDLAKFYAPIRIVLDSVGNVYVADSKNFSIRKVTADGTTLTLAGNGVEGSKDSTGIHAQFRDILGIAIDNSDNLFVTDNNRIRKIETSPKLHGNPAGQVGLHPVQLKVTDTNGEYSTQDFNINVGEVIPPTALCNDTTLYLDENGNAKVIAFDIDNFSYDDSGIASLEIDKGIFTCDDVGSPVIVTLTVTDNYVNVANCIATVTALDTIKPVFEPIADVEVVVSLAVSETGIEYPEILVTDNCDVVLEQLDGLGPEGMFPVGKTIETWQATDGGGNSVELSFNVNVILDNIPVFDAIEDTIVDEDISVLHIPLENILYGAENEIEISVTLFDETKTNLISDINVNYTNGESLALLDIFISADMNGEAIIQIDVTDDENRSSTNDFKIIVTPVNDAPILVNPVADIEIQLPEMVKFRLGKGKGEIFDDVDDEILDVEIKTVGGNKIPGWIFWSNDTIYAHPTKRDTGYFNIEIIASDDEGLSATDTFEIYVKKQIVVGTDDIEIQTFDAILYPNPANGIVNVEMNLSFKELSLEVYNNIGQVVLKESYLRNEDIVFDMSGKVSGLYFARLTSEGKHIIKKLMVNKN